MAARVGQGKCCSIHEPDEPHGITKEVHQVLSHQFGTNGRTEFVQSGFELRVSRFQP